MNERKREEMSELLGFDTSTAYERIMDEIRRRVMKKYRRDQIIYNSSLQPIGDN